MPVTDLTEEQIVELLQQMPDEQKKRVWQRLAQNTPERPRPQFGSGKADILYMADDFDAPLEEFREYMG